MAATDLIAVADLKTQLSIPAATETHDIELARFVSAATRPVEKHVGAVRQRTETETLDGGRHALQLSVTPVDTVTSVTVSGELADPSTYQLDGAAGLLRRVDGYNAGCWPAGTGNVAVVTVAGVAATLEDVPADYSLAALIISSHLWETRRGSAHSPVDADDVFDPRWSYSIPRRALELLGEPVPGIA